MRTFENGTCTYENGKRSGAARECLIPGRACARMHAEVDFGRVLMCLMSGNVWVYDTGSDSLWIWILYVWTRVTSGAAERVL